MKKTKHKNQTLLLFGAEPAPLPKPVGIGEDRIAFLRYIDRKIGLVVKMGKKEIKPYLLD